MPEREGFCGAGRGAASCGVVALSVAAVLWSAGGGMTRGRQRLWEASTRKDIGHGGDLTRANGGDFTKLNLAWLNWWLKGDETATGKGLLVGAGCSYCKDSAWEVMSEKIP